MKNARIRILLHLIIAAFILLWNYFLNYFYAQEYIPIIHIVAISAVYIFFYLNISIFFESLYDHSNPIRIIFGICYILLLWNLTWIIDKIIYFVLPYFEIILFDDNIPRNDSLFHYKIWDAFVSLNILAVIYFVLLRFALFYLKTKKIKKELAINRERVEDMKYTSHFMKNIFSESFGEMLLNNEPKDTRTKMDIVEFLGYILELEDLGKKDTWAYSLDKLHCFIRLLRKHYGSEAIDFKYVNDGSDILVLPRGILLFPLENCLKHAYISPDYPVIYNLTVENHVIDLECTSNTNHFKSRKKSGKGFLFLDEKIRFSDYTHVIEKKSNSKKYTLTMKLIPKSNGKAKIQYSTFG